MKRALFALALLAIISALLPFSVAADTNGRISGTVTNGTSGQPVSGSTVTVSRFDKKPEGGVMPQSVDLTAITTGDGRYSFDGLDTSTGLVYAVSVTFQGVLYSSGMVQISSSPEQTADISVYETTPDQSAVSLSSRGLILNAVDRETGAASIVDVFSFDNAGNKTVIAGDEGRTLRFSVPPNAAEVGPRAGFDFGTPSLEGSTVYATSPLRPGAANPASLGYVLPYSGSTFELSVTTDYPTQDVRILVPAGEDGKGARVVSDTKPLLDGGIISIGSQPYHVWSTGMLQKGDVLSLRFLDLPTATSANRALSTIEPALIAIVALLLATGVAGWVVRSRRLSAPRIVTVAPALADTLEARRAALTEELRGIEAAHTAGLVDSPEYQRSRRLILEDLRRISRAMRGIGDDE